MNTCSPAYDTCCSLKPNKPQTKTSESRVLNEGGTPSNGSGIVWVATPTIRARTRASAG
jgi:hypothetical protein